jgi:aspartate 1-decarboxylase
MLTDYHLHLQPDGAAARAAHAADWDTLGGHLSEDWIRRYADAARARGVHEIAITEHVHRFAEARDWHPTLVRVDEHNHITEVVVGACVERAGEP